jgi:hypothetical protein
VAQHQQFVSPGGERVFPFNPKYLREVTPMPTARQKRSPSGL